MSQNRPFAFFFVNKQSFKLGFLKLFLYGQGRTERQRRSRSLVDVGVRQEYPIRCLPIMTYI